MKCKCQEINITDGWGIIVWWRRWRGEPTFKWNVYKLFFDSSLHELSFFCFRQGISYCGSFPHEEWKKDYIAHLWSPPSHSGQDVEAPSWSARSNWQRSAWKSALYCEDLTSLKQQGMVFCLASPGRPAPETPTYSVSFLRFKCWRSNIFFSQPRATHQRVVHLHQGDRPDTPQHAYLQGRWRKPSVDSRSHCRPLVGDMGNVRVSL